MYGTGARHLASGRHAERCRNPACPPRDLYGDNTVIFRPQATEAQRLGPLSGDPAYIKATMNAEQVDALLRFALGAGGLLDEVETTEVYRPEAYRGFLTESFPGQVGEIIDWPWDDLSLDDFPSGDEPTRATTLTPEQVGAVTTEPTGGVAGLRISDEDGSVWQLAVRPLLPDEVANLDLDG